MISLLRALALSALLSVVHATPGLSLELAWVQGGFLQPTSVLLHPSGDMLLIANADGPARAVDGRGFISLLSFDGKLLDDRFIDGLDAPTGMAAVDGVLYVADLNRVRLFDLESRRELGEISPPGAIHLIDLAATSDGRVFASDPYAGAIYTIRDGHAARWPAGDKTLTPRALLILGEDLIIADSGATEPASKMHGPTGGLNAINLADGGQRQMIEHQGLETYDGVAADEERLFLSSSQEGRLTRIDAFGEETVLFLTPGISDLTLVGDLLVVPFPFDRVVRAYRTLR